MLNDKYESAKVRKCGSAEVRYGAVVQWPGYRIVSPEIGVRFPVASLRSSADIAQPAERDPAMVEAAGSNPAVRFIILHTDA